MLTTLTSWLRPASARSRKTALRAVEHLEDRSVPDSAPHNLFTGAFSQDWANAGLITTNNNWSGVGSVVGTGGTGLGLSAGADPRGIITPSTGAQQVTANEGGNPEDVTYSGIAEFQSLQVVAFRADATNQAPNLVLHLNTNAVNGVTVSFDVKDINPAPRSSTQPIAVQYRLSTDANFTNVAGGYVADVTTGASGLVTPFSVTLPTRADNLDPLTATVEVRIITAWAGGDDEWVGIDNIVVSANRRPTLTLQGGDPTWTEGLTANTPVQIAPTVPVSPQPPTVTDPDAPANLNGGALIVTITSGGVAAEDVLGVNNQGMAAGQIGVTGATVFFGGTNIGTITGGTGGAPLVINLNTNSNLTAASALVRQITYNNNSQDPTAGARVVSFVVRDNAGGVSLASSRTVTAVAVNDAPTAVGGPAVGVSPALFYEGQTVALTGISLADVDVRSAVMTVTLSVPAVAGTLQLRTDVVGGVTSAEVASNGTNAVTIFSTLAAINATLAAANGLVYTPPPDFNTDAAPAVQLTIAASDNGNTPGPVLNASATKSITVTGVNDPPVASPVGFASTLATASVALPFTLNSTPPVPLTLADVVGVTGPAGAAVSLTGASLAGGGTSYTLTFPSALAAGAYRVAVRPSTLDSATATLTATDTVLPFTLAAAPPGGGPLTKANIFSLTTAGGSALDLSQAVLAQVGASLTDYTLTFPNPLAATTYTLRLVYAVQPFFYPLAASFPVLSLAPDGTAADGDFPKSPDFNGGALTVQVFANGVPSPGNRLSIRSSPSTPGNAFLLTSTTVAYKPLDGSPAVAFGSVSGGTGSSPLVVSFNSDQVTPEVVAALMRAINFNVNTFDPTTRIVRFNLTDGDGVSPTFASTTPVTVRYSDADTFLVVNPQPVNNAPTFAVPAALAAVLEDAGAQMAAGFATSITPGPASYEAGQTVAFQVTNNSNPGLFSVVPAISPTGTLTFTPAPNANGTATITVQLVDNGGTANGGTDTSPTQDFTITVTAVNDAPSFTVPPSLPAVAEDAGPQTAAGFATSISPGPGPSEAGQVLTFLVSNDNTGLFSTQPAISPTGVLTFTAAPNANGTATVTVRLMDDGLAANGGVDTSAPQTFTITVNAVNDDPVLGGIAGLVPYLVGQPGTPVAGAATVSDDSADFDTGTLTVLITSGSTPADLLTVQNGGLVSLSAGNVIYNGTTVGTLAGGTGATPLVITFDPDATRPVVEAVLQNVVFSTPAGTTDRVLSVVLTDGDGGTSAAAGVTVRVADQVTTVSLTKTDPAAAVRGPSLSWVLTTDLPVGGFNPTNFLLVGTVAGSVTDPLVVTPLGSNTVEITATLTAPVQGTLGLNLVDETGLTVGILNVPPAFVGGVYNVDRVGPAVVSIDDGDGDDVVPVNQPVTYTVTFDEDVLNGSLTAADLANAGTAPVTFGTITETSPGVFTVQVTPTGAGTIILQLPATADVQDGLGNDSPAVFADDTTVAVDAVAPTVVTPVVNDAANPLPNVAAPGQVVTYTVTFSEDIDAASLAGAFSNVGTAAATVGAPVETGVPGVVTVTLTPTTTGTLVVRVAGVRDVAGNPMATAFTDTTVVTSNLPPTPQSDTYSLPEDGGTFTSPGRGVLTNDTDPNEPSTALTVDTPAITPPTKGTLTLRPDGTFDYTPSLNATGPDSFQYRVRDQFGGTATATVNLTITAVNDAPTFTVSQPTVAVFEDSGPASGITVLRNILPGPAGETEAINPVIVTAAPSGFFAVQPSIQLMTVAGELTGVLSFTPAPNQFGTATITVTVSDAGPGNAPNVNSRTQQFTIVITPVNDAPTLILSGNPPVSAEDGGLQTVFGFATFSPGPNEAGLGQTPAYTATVTGTSGGLTFVVPPAIDANGTLTYQAAPDATGTATVRVSLKDSGGTANGGQDTSPFTQSFTIVVRSQNDLPVANPDAALVPKGAGPTFINTLSNDTPDPDGSELLTVVSVTQPANGAAAVAPGGTGVLYAPAPGFIGTDTFTYTINDGNGGPATSTVTVTVRPVPAGQPLFDVVATGTGPGGGPVVRVNSLSTSAFTGTFAAYDPNFRGGVNVAVGDVNGDGVPDVVVTPGFGGGPHVKIVDGAKLGLVDETGAISEAAVLASFFAYTPSFRGGATVSVADMDGDGRADIVLGTGPGGGAHVKVISGRALTQFGNLPDGQVNPRTLLASFFAYDPRFTGGVNVSAGDVDGDGVADIVTAAGAGGGSHVKVFSGLGGPVIRSFFAYGASFRGGVNVAAGDVNGDGLADIITGAGVGGGPHVKVFDGGTGATLASFIGLTGSAAGADVAYRVTKDGTPLVVVGGQSGGSQVKAYAAPNFDLFTAFDAYEPSFLGGVEVG